MRTSPGTWAGPSRRLRSGGPGSTPAWTPWSRASPGCRRRGGARVPGAAWNGGAGWCSTRGSTPRSCGPPCGRGAGRAGEAVGRVPGKPPDRREQSYAMDLTRIYLPVREDLTALGYLLRRELSSDDPFIGELVSHVLTTQGKMVRPALVCLSALACGGGSEVRLPAAGAVELIHVAVLLGDYLFSKAFHMLAQLEDPEIASTVARATVRMAQAEIKQIKYGNTPHQSEAIYFDIIQGKTAELMSAACRCGALAASAPEEVAEALAAFGLEWGMAFQITDDALDLTASPHELGKPIGSDIQTGTVTLPIIHALAHAPEEDRRRLVDILTRANGARPPGGGDEMREIREILARTGAIEYALGAARVRARRALAALEALEESAALESLRALVDFVTVRSR